MHPKSTRFLMIILAILLFLLPAISIAETRNNSSTVSLIPNHANSTNANVIQTCFMDDVFFAYASDSNVYSWEVGNIEPILYCSLPPTPVMESSAYSRSFYALDDKVRQEWSGTVDCLAAGDNKLWGFNTTSGKIGELVKDTGIIWNDTPLDATSFMPSGYNWPLHVSNAYVSNGTLYVFAALDNAEYPRNNYQLLIFDISSGKCRSLDIPEVQGYCQYDKNSLMVLQWFEGGEFAFSILNLETAEITESPYNVPEVLGSQTVGGLAFDSETRRLFCVADEKLWVCNPDGATTAIASISIPTIVGETPAFFTAGRYAIMGTQLSIVSVADIIATPIVTLTIMGGYADEAYSSYVQKYPDTAVVFNNSGDWPTVAQIADGLVSGDDTWDIYEICIDNSFVSLKEKGYAADLCHSPLLLTEFASLYPEIRRALSTSDGVPVAYPHHLYSKEWKVNEGLWELIYGEASVPTTWKTYLEAMLLWEQEYCNNYPEISFCQNFDYADYVLKVMNSFAEQYYVSDSALNYHQAELLEALELLNKITETRALHGKADSFADAALLPDISIFLDIGFRNVLVDESTPSLTYSSELYFGVDTDDYSTISPPSFEQSEDTGVPALLYAMFINPHSKHIDAALKYLECISEYENDHRLYYAIHPDCHSPVEDSTYAEQIRLLESQRDSLVSQIANMENGIDRANLEDKLRYVEKMIENQDSLKWEISPTTISDYRDMAVNIRFFDDIPYVLGTGSDVPSEINDLINQYTDNAISLERFIREYEQKMFMRYLEDSKF